MRLQNINSIEPRDVNFSNTWHFLFVSKLRNEWVKEDIFINNKFYEIIDVYLRKSIRIIENKQIICIDVANISINQDFQNLGYFTKFIQELQKYQFAIYIESVVNKNIYNSLLNNNRNLNFKLINNSDLNKSFIWIP